MTHATLSNSCTSPFLGSLTAHTVPCKIIYICISLYIYMWLYVYILQSLQKGKVSRVCPYCDRVFLNIELRVFFLFCIHALSCFFFSRLIERMVAWQLGLPMRNNNSDPSQFVAERLRVFFFRCLSLPFCFTLHVQTPWESGRWFHDYFLYLVACFMILCSCFWAAALSTTKHPQQC